MAIDRSVELTLGRPKCSICHGYGRRGSRGNEEVTCVCVHRKITRAVIWYAQNKMATYHRPYVSWVRTNGGPSYAMPCVEYCADVSVVAENSLTKSQFQIFRLFHLEGRNWRECTKRLAIDRGTFFHSVYRIEAKLGRAYVAAQMYPPRDYFLPEIPDGLADQARRLSASGIARRVQRGGGLPMRLLIDHGATRAA